MHLKNGEVRGWKQGNQGLQQLKRCWDMQILLGWTFKEGLPCLKCSNKIFSRYHPPVRGSQDDQALGVSSQLCCLEVSWTGNLQNCRHLQEIFLVDPVHFIMSFTVGIRSIARCNRDGSASFENH